MKYLISQPSTLYYAWQTEVILNNMLQFNVNLNDVEVVCSGPRTKEWAALAKKYAARFFFYQNTAQSPYPSIGRPNALKQHFLFYKELESEAIFYMDCDILFLKDPHSFLAQLVDNDITYVSDTKWYIGYSYLDSKKKDIKVCACEYDTDQILQPLCKQVGITLDQLKQNDNHSGGAQYLFKGIDWRFWEEVEQDCTTIYKYFNSAFVGSINQRYFESESKGFQSFCADMWAVLWNLWKKDKQVEIHKALDFGWPGYPIDSHHNILHNAGVVSDKEGLFHKAKYISSLPWKDTRFLDNMDQSKLSWKYTETILKIKETTCL